MDAKNWKLLRRAAACLPLAIVAVQGNAFAEPAGTHGEREAGTWTFHHEHVLGTSLEVKVRAANFSEAQRAEAAALTEYDRQERILSAWRSDSEFSRWEKTRFQAVPVSKELFDVLARFDRWRGETHGALDASTEAAAQLWRRAAAEGRTPSDAELRETVEAMQQPHWQLDASNRTATRLTAAPLALASFAKSYVSQRAAEAAMRSGVAGVMLNAGGDVVVRGAMRQVVDVADPRAATENDRALDCVAVEDRAVATSGSYRRGVVQAAMAVEGQSHIVDPRTARPAGHVLSSTVIAKDAETAGALATAFSVLSPEQSAELANRMPGVDYLIVTADGRELRSAGWAVYRTFGSAVSGSPAGAYATYAPAAFVAAHAAAGAGLWNPAFALTLNLDLPRIDDARYRRPYVAVWIEDSDHYPVRTLALWTENPRWLPELKQWYRDDQVRNLSEGTDISKTVSSATRPPGHYSLKWDGKDNDGKPVKAGKYTVVIEASREHGGYQIEHKELDFSGQPVQATLPGGQELGTIALDYRKQ